MTRLEFDAALERLADNGADRIGSFRGYRYLGYVGAAERNYATDAWAHQAAVDLGWTADMATVWAASKYGRWAMDAQPMSVMDMYLQMMTADAWVRKNTAREIDALLADVNA